MIDRQVSTPPASATDKFFVALYLLGIYLGVAANLPGGVPLPGVVAGIAGLALLARHVVRVTVPEATCIAAVLAIALLSIVAAPDVGLLQERFKGFVQFAYSILIGYGFYLAARSLRGSWIARFFLAFCILILLAGALENAFPGFRSISDAFRERMFDTGVYAADTRDLALYGHIRPKVFTSEPSFVTFAFTFFGFAWYVLSGMRGKTFGFIGLLTLGYFVLRGPTIMLGVLLVPAYQALLAARTGPPEARRIDWSGALTSLAIAGAVAAAGLYVGTLLFEERLATIASGRDASVFARLIAPPLVAAKVLLNHPFGGVGLAGWEYIEATVEQVYEASNWLSVDLRFDNAAHSLTNWFWLHWIFLGLFFGIAMIGVLSVLLRTMGVQCIAFCWAVWAVFGQSAGSYVGPRTWAVLFLAAVVAVIHEREAQQDSMRRRTEPTSGFPDLAATPISPAVARQ